MRMLLLVCGGGRDVFPVGGAKDEAEVQEQAENKHSREPRREILVGTQNGIMMVGLHSQVAE